MDALKGLSFILVLALGVILILAAIRDSRHYIIGNKTVGAVLVLAVLFHGAQLLSPAEFRLHADLPLWLFKAALLAGLVFAVTAGLFSLGLMGGGDVKLLSVMMLWCGPGLALPFLLVTALAGGFVSVFILLRRKLSPKVSQPEASLIVNPLGSILIGNAGPGTAGGPYDRVPYGLGIGVGGLYVVWELMLQLTGVM